MKVPIILLISTCILLIPFSASSQVNLNRATREINKSPREKVTEELLPPPEEKPEIKKEKKEEELRGLKFFVKKIKLEGVESFPPESFQPIIRKYENRELTFSEIKILARKIEREYLKRGIIAACIIPPQKIQDNIVTLRVIEAHMGDLEIKHHKYFRENRLRYYWHIKPGEVMRYDKISRSLQMMNKNPDRKVKAILHAGKKAGTTDVTLETITHFPVHFISSLDREGVPSTGRLRTTLGIKHNNLLGMDDSLISGYMWGSDFGALYVYHSIPVTSWGTTLIYGFSYSKSFPKKDYEAYGIRARAKDSSVFLHQDLFKKEKYLGEMYFGIEAKDKTTSLNTGTFVRDRLRIITVGGNFIKRNIGAITYIQPVFSQGINGLGARRKNELSSRGAKNTFSKFNLSLTHRRMISETITANLIFKTQVSSTRLTPQEEFSLGGTHSVRGYPDGDYLADNAVQTNMELLIPCAIFLPGAGKSHPFMKGLKTTKLVLFFDYGYGRKRDPLPGERKSVNFAGAGLGFRIHLFHQMVLNLAWGFPVADDTITESARSRFHISFDFESKLPEKWE